MMTAITIAMGVALLACLATGARWECEIKARKARRAELAEAEVAFEKAHAEWKIAAAGGDYVRMRVALDKLHAMHADLNAARELV